jgi:DNA end-binding protein Ku
MIVKTLYYYDEIVVPPKQFPKMELDENEMLMAKMLIENMTKPFVAEKYKDEYQQRLRDAIMSKIQGKEIVSTETEQNNNVIDLMEALKQSLDMTKFNHLSGTA